MCGMPLFLPCCGRKRVRNCFLKNHFNIVEKSAGKCYTIREYKLGYCIKAEPGSRSRPVFCRGFACGQSGTEVILNGVGRGENKQNKSVGALLTRETIGMTLLLFSAVMLLITVTGGLIFGEIGVAIAAFFVGFAGFFVYPLLALLLYASVVLVFGRKPIPARWIARVYFLLAAIFLIVHAATAGQYFSRGFGGYMNACWTAASDGVVHGTGGGVLLGLIAYPVRALLSDVGSYILYALLVVLALYLIALDTPLRAVILPSARRRPEKKSGKREVAFEDLPEPPRTSAQEHTVAAENAQPAAYSGYQTPYAAPQYAQQETYVPQYPVQAPTYPAGSAAGGRPYAEERPAPKVQPPLSAQDAYERSRDILFSSDPASDYRSNLIFDRDSRFNTYPRRSSVGPSGTPADADKTAAPSRDAASSRDKASASGDVSYTERYFTQAESSRPVMPKRVTQERPASSIEQDDFNYPQSPSYRAPSIPLYPAHDYYANDVPYVTDQTEDLPAPEPMEQPSQTARPSYTPYAYPQPSFASSADAPSARNAADPDPARGVSAPEPEPAAKAEPAPEPAPAAEPEREARPAPEVPERVSYLDPVKSGELDLPVQPSAAEESAPVYPAQPSPYARREEPAPQEQASSSESKAREREYRSIFSRPVEERTRVEDTPASNLPERFDRTKLSRADRFEMPEQVQNDPISEGGSSIFERSPEADAPPAQSRVYDAPVRSSAADLFDGDADIDDADFREEPAEPVTPVRERGISRGRTPRGALADAREFSEIPEESKPAPQPKKHKYKKYVRPDVNNLNRYDDTVHISQEEIEHNSEIILDTLQGFRVDAEVVKVTIGSAVTRYDIDIPRNIAVRSVIKRDAEIAMRLHARDGVNIYSNSEVGAISVEVPNSVRATVGLRSVMDAPEYVNAKPNSLMFAIGKDVEGRNVCGNIVKMKHILVAGSTGSGKSVCLNAMLISLICKYSPEELRLILIDPKKVEFAVFDGLPHLMINEIIADAQKAVSALNWAIKEMERRYTLFEQKTRSGSNVHNLDEYNASLEEGEEKLPKIVIVVDELADLMSVAKKDIEDRIQRLAQKARAAGMHLVIATQRPSVDVITGVIKGNLPTRLAFRVIQEVDSRTILDESGAEKLLGLGDMLYRTEGMYSCLRVQGAFLDSKEVQRIVEDIKAHNEAYFDESVADYINKSESGAGGEGNDDADGGTVDPQYIKALAIVVKLGSASISLIQRKCSVGYNHAGKIIEWMELMGYISPFDGKAKARTVLLTKEDFEAKYGDIDG